MLKSRLARRLVPAAALALIGVVGLGEITVATAAPMHLAGRASTKIYTVQYGDSLKRIGKVTNTALKDLLALNKLRLSSVVWPGMRLRLPSTSVVPTLYVTVRSGDSYAEIARSTRVKVADLLAANRRTRSSKLTVGDRLVLPAGAVLPHGEANRPTSQPPKPEVLTYTVRAGDSFIRIASRTGVKTAALVGANGLELTSRLRVGMVLKLPKGAHLPEPAPGKDPGKNPGKDPDGKPFRYRVHVGDMLSGIAHRAGVPLSDLLKLNHLTQDSAISAGDILLIPAGGTDPTDGAPGQTPVGRMPPTRQEAIDRVLGFVRDQLGKPYKYFAAGPDSYDCSGLTMAAYLTLGIRLPHQSTSQSLRGTTVDWVKDGIQAGDLIFTKSSHGTRPIGHVSIAVSRTKLIHAPRTGDVVRYRDMWEPDRIVKVQRYV